MQYDGRFRYFKDNKQRLVNAWTIECQCYLKGKDEIEYNGARPDEKTLWAVFMINESEHKITITIKTLFRGSRLNHTLQQERIKILRNGKVEKRFYGKKLQ